MLKRLIASLEDRTELPIEVEEIASLLVELGFQDQIQFFGVAEDRAKIRGAFYQFTIRRGVYADPELVTLIAYNNNDTVEMQRLTCCKELMHLFDRDIERTDKEDEVPSFLDKLLGPLSTDDFGLADLMAVKDKIATYQCLPLLMPKAALSIARRAVAEGKKTPQEVANWAKLPLPFVELMLDEQWETINGALVG
jgi:hypothetical protein